MAQKYAHNRQRQEQVIAIQREYMNANEFAFNHLKEQLPLVVPQIVLSCGQIMGDSSAEDIHQLYIFTAGTGLAHYEPLHLFIINHNNFII